MMSASHIQSLCRHYGLSPSKRYGQHYLVREESIQRMIEAAELVQDDTVVEIGSGFGVLTLAVAPLVKKVTAFEIEQKLKPYWEETLEEYKIERLKDWGDIKIVWGNVLTTFIVHSSPPRGRGPASAVAEFGERYKVLANLPYHITSNVLRMFLENEQKPERIVVMVQKEVAERICAGKGDMNLLALSVQYYGDPSIVCTVSRSSFWPQPQVDSAVVAVTVEHESMETLKHDSDIFFRVARAGFTQKRKQLWRNLSRGLHIDGDVVKAGVRAIVGDEKARAEDLSVEEWKRLAEVLYPRLSV